VDLTQPAAHVRERDREGLPAALGRERTRPAKDSCGALHSREGLVVVVVDLEVVLAAEAARAGPRSVAMMTRAAKVTGARCSRREFGVTARM